MKSSTTFSKKNNIKNKEGRPHCWNRSKKEDHIVGTDPISNITSITVSTLCSLRYTPAPHICPTYFHNQNITDCSNQK